MAKLSNIKIQGKIKIIKDFCQSTSLHGFGYFYLIDSIILKVFWVTVILGMTGLGIHLVIQNTLTFLKANIVTTIDSSATPLDVSTFIVHIGISGLAEAIQNQVCKYYIN